MTLTNDEFASSGSSPQSEWEKIEDRVLFHALHDPLLTDFPGLIDRDLWSASETMVEHAPNPYTTLASLALNYVEKHGAAPNTETERLIEEMRVHKDHIPAVRDLYARLVAAQHASDYADLKRHLVDGVLYRAREQKLLAESNALKDGGYPEIEAIHRERIARIEASRAPVKAADGSFTTTVAPRPKRSADIEGSRLRSWDASDYVKRVEEWEYLCHPFWAYRALSVISAPAGVGKTYMALGLAEAVVKGGTFLGHEVKRKTGRVFALLSDDAPPLIKKRLMALSLNKPGTVRVADSEDWQGSGTDVLGSIVMHVGMMDGVDLVIVDAKYCFTPPTAGASNDLSVMETVAKALLGIATATGASVILIDHDSKAGAHMIGSSVIGFKAFSVILLQPVEERKEEDGAVKQPGYTVLEFFKQKDLERPWPVLRLKQDDRGIWINLGPHDRVKSQERTDDLAKKILAKLKTTEGMTETALVTAASVRKQDMLTWLHAAAKQGLVYQTGSAKKGDPRLWWKGSKMDKVLENLSTVYRRDAVSVPDPIPGNRKQKESSGNRTVVNNGKSKLKESSPDSESCFVFPPLGGGTETESSDEGQGGSR